jgi:hypothetical protein
LKKKEDSLEFGTDYEHQTAKDYSTQQHMNSNNSSIGTKMICIQTFLQRLTPAEYTDYSLWMAIKKIKQVKKPSPPLRTSQETCSSRNIEKHTPLLNA